MKLTLYESVIALANIYKQPVVDVIEQLGVFDLRGSSLTIAKDTFDKKFSLIDDKKKALTNISSKTAQMSDSNAVILNNAFEVARRAYNFRLNLEISVLMSQLKNIEIETAQVKLMNAEDFISKYGI